MENSGPRVWAVAVAVPPASTPGKAVWRFVPPLNEAVSPDTEEHEDGLWIVASDDHFGPEIVQDLEDAGLDATLVWPVDVAPDVSGAVGLIAGGEDDATNLAMAGHARLVNTDLFLSVRQRSRRNEPLLRAFAPDSVFVPAQLTVQEALARPPASRARRRATRRPRAARRRLAPDRAEPLREQGRRAAGRW